MRKTRRTDALSAENVATWSGTTYLVPQIKKELMRRLHEVGQAAFDKKYGHGEFEKIFKKNYLNREETER